MSQQNEALDIRALQARLRVAARERDWERFHSPKNLAMALAVEVAELVEIFQWMTPEESASLSAEGKAALADELADITIYLVRLADVTRIDLSAAVDSKLASDRRRTPGERGWDATR